MKLDVRSSVHAVRTLAVRDFGPFSVVRMQQIWHGLPVFGSEIVISVKPDGEVIYVQQALQSVDLLPACREDRRGRCAGALRRAPGCDPRIQLHREHRNVVEPRPCPARRMREAQTASIVYGFESVLAALLSMRFAPLTGILRGLLGVGKIVMCPGVTAAGTSVPMRRRPTVRVATSIGSEA